MINILEELQTKLKKEKKNNISPNIDQDLEELFESINESAEESTDNNYCFNLTTNEEIIEEDSTVVNEERRDDNIELTKISINIKERHKYALVGIIMLGEKTAEQKNYVNIKVKKKERIQRNESFIHTLHEEIKQLLHNQEDEFFNLNKTVNEVPIHTKLFQHYKAL